MPKDADDDICRDCGHGDDYVDPDSGLCDLCATVNRAMRDGETVIVKVVIREIKDGEPII